MDGNWVCISIDIQYMRGSGVFKLLHNEMRRVFGNDFIDIMIMGDRLCEDYFEMKIENYIFVKCRDYRGHIQELKKSNIVIGVLESYDNPIFIPEEEIYSFKRKVEKGNQYSPLHVGDVVIVKEGYLKKLNGVVVRILSLDSYDVVFKLYTKTFSKVMNRKNLDFDKNIFDNLRIPVVKYNKKSSKNKKTKHKRSSSGSNSFTKGKSNEGSICRSKHRKNGRNRGKKKR